MSTPRGACCWFDPPDDLDRSGPVHLLGGDLEALWDYDPDEQEWSDDYRLGELAVTASSFLVSTIDRFINDVVLRTDTDPVKHMRMAALHPCRPLHGPELISAWRARAVYPDKLAAAVVERSLSADVLTGWAAREALASRGTIWPSRTCSPAPDTWYSARSWRSTASTRRIS